MTLLSRPTYGHHVLYQNWPCASLRSTYFTNDIGSDGSYIGSKLGQHDRCGTNDGWALGQSGVFCMLSSLGTPPEPSCISPEVAVSRGPRYACYSLIDNQFYFEKLSRQHSIFWLDRHAILCLQSWVASRGERFIPMTIGDDCVVSMLTQCHRRWPSIEATQGR